MQTSSNRSRTWSPKYSRCKLVEKEPKKLDQAFGRGTRGQGFALGRGDLQCRRDKEAEPVEDAEEAAQEARRGDQQEEKKAQGHGGGRWRSRDGHLGCSGQATTTSEGRSKDEDHRIESGRNVRLRVRWITVMGLILRLLELVNKIEKIIFIFSECRHFLAGMPISIRLSSHSPSPSKRLYIRSIGPLI